MTDYIKMGDNQDLLNPLMLVSACFLITACICVIRHTKFPNRQLINYEVAILLVCLHYIG